MINRLIYAVTALALLIVLVFDETFAANLARDLGEEAAIMLDPWVAGIGGVFLGLLAAAFYRERRSQPAKADGGPVGASFQAGGGGSMVSGPPGASNA